MASAGINFTLLGAIHYLTSLGYTVCRPDLNNPLHYGLIPAGESSIFSHLDRKALINMAKEICYQKHQASALRAAGNVKTLH